MDLLTQHWLASISCLCFVYLTIGISTLDYLDMRLYEIEMGVSRLKNLDKLVRPGGMGISAMYYDWFLGDHDKILIPPSKRKFGYWMIMLLLAVPIGSFLLLLLISSFGDYPIPSQRFSLTELFLWPRTLSVSMRKLEESNKWYTETKIRVIKEIQDINSL